MDAEIEMQFVRVLSVHGENFAGPPTTEKRERIRHAILRQRLGGEAFEPGETYAQAFTRCYNRPLGTNLVPASEEPRVRGIGQRKIAYVNSKR